jgi:geranylgeranyl pyrophosphate synthase
MTMGRKSLPSNPMRAEESLRLKKAEIDRELGRLLPRGRSGLGPAMRHAVFPGGKRYRPLLLMASGACFAARRGALLPFACALELIHCYSLVHDDLPAMDNDDFRRGRPSCHRAFGEGAAILAGDGLLTLAFGVMAGAPVPGRLLAAKHKAIQALSRRAGVEGMIGGQWLDISLPLEKLTRRRLDEMILRKTGALILGAIEAGALLGRAGRGDTQAVLEFGEKLGLAFQVRDDIADSDRERAAARPARPDHTVLHGLEGSRIRLRRLVEEGVASIARFGERAAELRWLALSLVEGASEAKNG